MDKSNAFVTDMQREVNHLLGSGVNLASARVSFHRLFQAPATNPPEVHSIDPSAGEGNARGDQPQNCGDYFIVWNGRGPLTEWPEKDWKMLLRDKSWQPIWDIPPRTSSYLLARY